MSRLSAVVGASIALIPDLISVCHTYEDRQQQLCIEVFQPAEIGNADVIINVGVGSGEQDFLLSKAYESARLIGFSISERQVRYANERAKLEPLTDELSFRLEKPSVFLSWRRGFIGGPSAGRHPIVEPYRVGEPFPNPIRLSHQ